MTDTPRAVDSVP